MLQAVVLINVYRNLQSFVITPKLTVPIFFLNKDISHQIDLGKGLTINLTFVSVSFCSKPIACPPGFFVLAIAQ